MKNLFNDISQEERKRILEMHENATKRNYLMEQGVTPQPSTTSGGTPDKLTVLKTDETKRDKFAYLNPEDLRKYFGPNALKRSPNDAEENHDTYKFIQRAMKSPLTWYAKTGNTPQKIKLSQAVSYIEKMLPGFADDYAAVTGTPPYQTPKLMKAGLLDTKFEQIYNDQMIKV
jgi:hypothetical protein